ncbi:MAG: F420-dependent glucose-6-phosphate dehydrogenase [Acidimicrobiales bacterium]|nr:MAG: TIGR03564 family F420-dependent LLM class oxidoreductase [Actinomycetota bacterium]MBV6509373.1 F420-dependent glucose-6-phosphate dehydrogenase [Acidimicrobiales bacterium]RIK04593.1 MAG: LLM class F420-dependent oxidoreductase [Acidobacteriota bacterium]
MRIGINGSSLVALGSPVQDVAEHAAQVEADGFTTYWVAQLAVPDALTALAVVGLRTSTIELGTAVIATWPRHPLMLAAQALTTQQIVANRLLLGIGLAHKPSIETTLKVPFERPARNMDEYLSVLLPALRDRRVGFTGEIWSGEVEAMGGPPGVEAPSVMLAAMGPRMLALAGSRTDGTILWLAGPTTIADYIRPALHAAADGAGRREPRIVASVPVCVTSEPGRVREAITQVLGRYRELPSYRQIMDREGAEGPADVSLVGDEDEVRAGLDRFAVAGTTDFSALEFVTNDDEVDRTRRLLKDVAAGSR